MMDIESGGDNSFVVVPCLEDCLEKFTDLSETFQSTRFGGSYKITVSQFFNVPNILSLLDSRDFHKSSLGKMNRKTNVSSNYDALKN